MVELIFNNIQCEDIFSEQYAPIFAGDEIHYWQFPLDKLLPYIKKLETFLSRRERDQFSGFIFMQDYNYRVITRGTLRLILSKYENKSPNQIKLHYNKNGKPYLAKRPKQNLLFNVSSSNGIAVIVVAQNRRVGVDIEYVRPDIEYENIIDRFFSESESAILQTIPSNNKLEEFFICWTCKEAYLKAIGTGLSLPMNRIHVYNECSLSTQGDIRYSRKSIFNKEWSFFTFSLLSPTIVTMVGEGTSTKLRFFVYN